MTELSWQEKWRKANDEAEKRGGKFVHDHEPYGTTILCEAEYNQETGTVTGVQLYHSNTSRLMGHSRTSIDTDEKTVQCMYVKEADWKRGRKLSIAM